MTQPTPNSPVHSLPPAIAKQQAQNNADQIKAGAKRLIDGIINSVLWHLSGGLLGHNPATQQAVTPSTQASGYMSSFYNTAVVKPVDQSRIPVVPASHVSATTPNLLLNGGFDNNLSVSNAPGFVWDNTVDHTGNGGGSALATASGSTLTLTSPTIPVSSKDLLSASGWVQWAGVSATSGAALQINIVTYLSGSQVAVNTVATLPASGTLASSSAWTAMSSATALSVPASGVDSVAVQVVVNSVVLSGSVWFDDLTLTKTGAIDGNSLVTGLTGVGSTIVGDLQGTLDSIGQAIFGGLGGHSPATVKNGLSNIPAENIIILPNPTSSGVVFDAIGSGWVNTYTTSYPSQSLTGSHTCAGNFVMVIACAETSSAGSPTISATYGGVPMAVLGSRAGAYGSSSTMRMELFGLFNPPTGSQNVTVTSSVGGGGVCYGLTAGSASYSGVTGIGNIWANNGVNSSPSITAASVSTIGKFVNGLVTYKAATGGSTSLASYSQTSRYYSGNVPANTAFAGIMGDAATGASVTFSATAGVTSGTGWLGVAVELESNAGVLGSGGRWYYNTSTGVGISSGSHTAGGLFATAWTSNTSDYAYNTGTSTVTVSQAGWYIIHLSYGLVSGLGGPFYMAPTLYQGGFIIRYGNTFNYPNGSATEPRVADTWTMYLNAGDSLQAGYTASSSVSGAITGDNGATKTTFDICLANRSMI